MPKCITSKIVEYLSQNKYCFNQYSACTLGRRMSTWIRYPVVYQVICGLTSQYARVFQADSMVTASTLEPTGSDGVPHDQQNGAVMDQDGLPDSSSQYGGAHDGRRNARRPSRNRKGSVREMDRNSYNMERDHRERNRQRDRSPRERRRDTDENFMGRDWDRNSSDVDQSSTPMDRNSRDRIEHTRDINSKERDRSNSSRVNCKERNSRDVDRCSMDRVSTSSNRSREISCDRNCRSMQRHSGERYTSRELDISSSMDHDHILENTDYRASFEAEDISTENDFTNANTGVVTFMNKDQDYLEGPDQLNDRDRPTSSYGNWNSMDGDIADRRHSYRDRNSRDRKRDMGSDMDKPIRDNHVWNEQIADGDQFSRDRDFEDRDSKERYRCTCPQNIRKYADDSDRQRHSGPCPRHPQKK